MNVFPFPGHFTMPLPRGGEIAFHFEAGSPITVMAWSRHRDAGSTVGVFPTWDAALASARTFQAQIAELEGCK